MTRKWKPQSQQPQTHQQFSTQKLSVSCQVEIQFTLNVLFVFAWIQIQHKNVHCVQHQENESVVLSLTGQMHHWLIHRLLQSGLQSSTLLIKVKIKSSDIYKILCRRIDFCTYSILKVKSISSFQYFFVTRVADWNLKK